MAKDFNDENFKSEVIEASKTKPVLVDFYAEWCGPCRMQGPVVEEVSNEIGDKASVGKLDTEGAMKTAQEFNIMSIPTLLIFRDGKVVESFVGVQSKNNLLAALNKHL